MPIESILTTLVALLVFSYFLGRKRSITVSSIRKGQRNLHSLPSYYGYLLALWAGIPALFILALWTAFDSSIVISMTVSNLPDSMQTQSSDELELFFNEIQSLANLKLIPEDINVVKRDAAINYQRLQHISTLAKTVIVLVIALIGMLFGWQLIHPKMQARNSVETVIRWFMIICASLAILTTAGIIFSVLFESIHFFKAIPPSDFLLGTRWSPQTAIRADQVGSSGSFGAIPLFIGTLLISTIALIIAVPLGLMSAIYLSEYASSKVRAIAKPTLEILAGIPTVVYGFFAALTVAPFIRDLGESIGLSVASESALAAGLVMGVMIIPFISSLLVNTHQHDFLLRI